jgi:glycosyltransferase involved in cell wall biosynthesis
MLCTPWIILYYALRHAKKHDCIFSDNYPCFPGATIASRLYKKKVFVSVHGIEHKKFLYRSFLEVLLFSYINILFKLCAPFITTLITNSPKTTRFARQLFKKTKISEAIPPVNIRKLKVVAYEDIRKKYKIENKIILLCVGVLHKMKNQELAIETLQELRTKGYDTVLVLAGGGDQNRITTILTQKKLEEHVIFTGVIPLEELRDYYHSCDILLQPAYYPEGLGLTPFEAMLFRKCTITVNGAGGAEIIQKNKLGYTANANKTEFTQKALKYLQNKNAYKTYAENGYTYVTQNLTPEKYYEQIIKVI